MAGLDVRGGGLGEGACPSWPKNCRAQPSAVRLTWVYWGLRSVDVLLHDHYHRGQP